jgi:predicted metalloprotease
MRWQGGRQSDNVEDQRRSPAPVMAGIGGGVGLIIMIIFVLLSGGNIGDVLKVILQNQQQLAAPNNAGGAAGGGPAELTPEEVELGQFVSTVLADTEDTWHELFRQMGGEYREPKLVLFSGQVRSACGHANASMGPFYCPGDEKVYIDLSFYKELKSKFKAPGDFAQAYVIAHEIGHHVQNLLGTSDKVTAAQQRMSKEEANQMSVRLELQADFLAGVWANHAQKARQILESGDLEEAMRAANAIGDDTLQKQSQGYVVPDSFTHGSSEQRIRWFKKGMQSGNIKDGDTFSIPYEQL